MAVKKQRQTETPVPVKLTQAEEPKRWYPEFICNDCGFKASDGRKAIVSTYHMGFCDICGNWKAITEPRDFFYPKFDQLEKAPEKRHEGT